jgi:hypothetical protein
MHLLFDSNGELSPQDVAELSNMYMWRDVKAKDLSIERLRSENRRKRFQLTCPAGAYLISCTFCGT